MGQWLIIPDYSRIDESLALAKQYGLGFEYNDFFTPVMLDHKEACKERIGQYLSLDLPPYCTTHGDFFDVLIFSIDAKIRKISEERILESMEVAQKLHCRGVVFHTNHTSFITTDVYMNGWVQSNKTFFTKVCGMYPDISVYLENMFDTTPDLLARLAAEMKDVPNFGVCFDYAHASAFGHDIDSWVTALAPYVKHLHLNDNDLQDDLHLAIGDGKIDWKQFKTYYDRYFTGCSVLVEVNSIEAQRKSLEYITALGIEI